MAGYCTSCGSALRDNAAFCSVCGAAARKAPVANAGPDAPPPRGITPASASIAGTVATISSMSGAVAALPWQTITTGEPVNVRAMLSAGSPLLQSAIRSSIRRPAIALLLTSLLDLAVALLSGQPAALRMVGIRVGMAAATSVVGIMAAGRGGALLKVTGWMSVLSAVVGLVSLLVTLWVGLANPVSILPLLPSLVSQAASLFLLLKTALIGLRS